jgi:hypothetical protein
VTIEMITDENLPVEGGVRYGRNRLFVVDREKAQKVSESSISALVDELLPKAVAGLEVEPDEERRRSLWGQAVIARDVEDGGAHQIHTWQEFCADQAAASAYRLRRAGDDETKIREQAADYAYYAWNLDQLAQAAAVSLD